MRQLPVPERGELIEGLRGFLNVGSDESGGDERFKLIVAWLLGAFRARPPYPILAIDGPQGAAKSTMARLLRRLVDPNQANTTTAPANEIDLLVAADNGWMLAFDNQSEISFWLSDALCRVATGAGISTRTLYTNKEVTTIAVARPVLLNGITGIGTRADLVDRAMVVTLPEIDEAERRTERELEHVAFPAAWPGIFGALLDALVAAVRDEDSITPAATRMSDFATFVTAAEPALGWQRGDFLAAYQENRNAASAAAVDADPVATAVRCLVEGYGYDDTQTGQRIAVEPMPLPYEATPTALHAELEEIVGRLPGGAGMLKSKLWPAAVNRLKASLRRGQGPLRRAGVVLELDARGPPPKRERLIVVRRAAGV